ncbi:MAG: N-acetyltransferase [Lachnospiraceae bacterium]|nr:N-acetyltransferase [Lachnospiraceae bacterium]
MKINTELYRNEMRKMALEFSSGNGFLDHFLKSDEAFDDGIGKTFVWINKKRTKIIGYYNIGVGYIDTYNGDDKYKIGGSVHLNFFALDSDYRGVSVETRADGSRLKVSDQLFADFMQKVYELRENYIGFSFVTLAATDEGYSLYKRNMFEELDDDLHFSLKDDEKGCRPMYLALDYE